MRSRRSTIIVQRTLLALTCAFSLQPGPARAGRHPCLLIKPDDIPRLRHACGIGPAPAKARGLGRFGERAADFSALRSYFSQRLGDVILAGELPAAAFLHLVDPDDRRDGARLAAINSALAQPVAAGVDTVETVLALDWCWEALDPEARREFLLQMRRHAEPLATWEFPAPPPS